ncbi:IS66 family insertion sequence element accessory protein TnpB [Vibrio parahaemolyticus]|nr:IS66 family insertion sequence element accessory protein TnpB [Vibrio parahaemolyticus]MBE4025897.1 IS66 family insertion sequence element accessory protein TnpB [Vibrio parahaemolyticus]HCE3039112.1 IS66 family insertion sequence element accessory protein TnpB [Vibrio parahaemolyticus]HCE5197567.1 IS66 family insertion sequence element accessory protein TnpB [Vibrio parahaemolyticus]
MIHLTAESKILLATQPADFRCGIDGLAALCRHQLKQSPRSGTLFVFTNRRQTMLRALCYDGSGFRSEPLLNTYVHYLLVSSLSS